jgi:hypothetical protein
LPGEGQAGLFQVIGMNRLQPGIRIFVNAGATPSPYLFIRRADIEEPIRANILQPRAAEGRRRDSR